MKPRPGTRSSPLLCAVLLAACARSSTPPRHPELDVHVSVTGMADAGAKVGCALDVAGVLRRHGFVPEGSGPRVEVEAALTRDLSGDLPGGTPDHPHWRAPAGSTEEPTVAHLTARVSIRDQPPRILRSASNASDGACALAAERLADALQETVDAAP